MRFNERKCTLAIIGGLMLGLTLDSVVASAEAPLGGHFVFFDAEEETDKDEAGEDDGADDNLYLARKGLSPDELIDFIFKMEEKPLSIQKREGFSEALVEAADRVLASDTKAAYRRIATITKFAVLHKEASFGNEDADKQLEKFVEEVKGSEDKRVVKEVEFLQLERKVINSGGLSLEEVQELLKELNVYFAAEKLEEKHLRMASRTVRTINRLDSDDADEKDKYADMRESYFTEFGSLFAKSDNKKLAAYGKKLAKSSGSTDSDLVGKPLELAGETVDGAAFNWDAYRGSVVIVDFWATWCGPCIRELPNVKAFYEKNKDRGLDIVGVSLDKNLDALDIFLEQHKIAWETLAGKETQGLAKKYGVQGIPTMMLVDQKGNVVAVSHKIGDLTAQAEKLLAKLPAKK